MPGLRKGGNGAPSHASHCGPWRWAQSDLTDDGAVLGEGVAQWRLIEAPPICAEVVVVIHVIQHFAWQLLKSVKQQRACFLALD